MKRTFAYLLIPLTHLALGCDQPTSPGSLDNLRAAFVSGYIIADMMPTIPPVPDRIGCQIVLVAENKSKTEALSGISFGEANVYLTSSVQKVGTISFWTDWDGRLGPSQQDTVRLYKVRTQNTTVTAQCGKYVYVGVTVLNSANQSLSFQSDSLLFQCVY